jgi:integrase-like protein
VQYLILDRDPLYTAAFRRLLRGSGEKPLVLPASSPNLNAFAARFVESAKSECLERIVPLGEGHLRAAVRAFVQHYHEERPHQGLSNELIAPKTTSIGTGPVMCRARLGGVLKFYDREADSQAQWAEFSHTAGCVRSRAHTVTTRHSPSEQAGKIHEMLKHLQFAMHMHFIRLPQGTGRATVLVICFRASNRSRALRIAGQFD